MLLVQVILGVEIEFVEVYLAFLDQLREILFRTRPSKRPLLVVGVVVFEPLLLIELLDKFILREFV